MPLLPLHYSDLAFNESLGDLVRNEDNTKWINVEKLLGITNTIQSIQKFQKSDFRFKPIMEIQEHILRFPTLTAKEAEDYAVRLTMGK